jgi:hypothetical protein
MAEVTVVTLRNGTVVQALWKKARRLHGHLPRGVCVSAGAGLDVGVYRIDDGPLELAGTKGGASMPA